MNWHQQKPEWVREEFRLANRRDCIRCSNTSDCEAKGVCFSTWIKFLLEGKMFASTVR